MTRLEHGKPLLRETSASYRGRTLILELYPSHLDVREKGRRDRISVDYRTILEVGYKIRWNQQQAAKREAKKNAKSMRKLPRRRSERK